MTENIRFDAADGKIEPDYSDFFIETDELVLKKAKEKDLTEIYRNLWSREESARYMLWDVTTSEEEAAERMRRTIAFQRANKYAFLVYEKENDRPIGFAGMREIEPGVYEDTGVALGPDFLRKGYGTQILNALAEEAGNCGAHKFIASCRKENIASHELQMKCGFRFVKEETRIDPRNGESYILEFNKKILARVGAIIMASGVSKRFGSNKLLAKCGGKMLIEHILDKAQASSLTKYVVVTRHPEIAAICSKRHVPCALHDMPHKNDTLRLGTAFLTEGAEALADIARQEGRTVTVADGSDDRDKLDGIMILPGDQPLLRVGSIEALIRAFCEEKDKILRLRFGEDVGLPTIFPADFFEGLKSLPEEKGGAYLIKKVPERVRTVEAFDRYELADSDTPEELAVLNEEYARRG